MLSLSAAQWAESGVVFSRSNSSSLSDVLVSFCDMATCGKPKQRQLMSELFQLEGTVLYSTLLEKFWQILLYLTDDAVCICIYISLCDVKFSITEGNCREKKQYIASPVKFSNYVTLFPFMAEFSFFQF